MGRVQIKNCTKRAFQRAEKRREDWVKGQIKDQYGQNWADNDIQCTTIFLCWHSNMISFDMACLMLKLGLKLDLDLKFRLRFRWGLDYRKDYSELILFSKKQTYIFSFSSPWVWTWPRSSSSAACLNPSPRRSLFLSCRNFRVRSCFLGSRARYRFHPKRCNT